MIQPSPSAESQPAFMLVKEDAVIRRLAMHNMNMWTQNFHGHDVTTTGNSARLPVGPGLEAIV